MLSSPAPFPLVGSFGLVDHEGLRRLCRIIATDPRDGFATLSLPERPDAGGTLRLPLADVLDGTPLTRDEYAELRQLEVDLFDILRGRKRARTPRQKRRRARYTQLAIRRALSGVLAHKLATLEAQQRRQRAFA